MKMMKVFCALNAAVSVDKVHFLIALEKTVMQTSSVTTGIFSMADIVIGVTKKPCMCSPSIPVVLISSAYVYSSTALALLDLQLRTILVCLILGLGAALQFQFKATFY